MAQWIESSFHPIQSIQQRDAESPYSLFHRNIQTSPQQRFSPNVDWASNHVANQVSKSDLKYQTLPITPNISPQEPDLVQQSHFPTGYSATPPAGYVCKLCFVDGHWLRNCTLYLERKQGNIQHQKFMQELESPANALLSEQVKMQLSVQSQQFHLGSSRLKTFPPDGYVCRKCNIVGHWYLKITLGSSNVQIKKCQFHHQLIAVEHVALKVIGSTSALKSQNSQLLTRINQRNSRRST